eukprot:augustus_masked-scaffold_31-processed-gene-2.54-mRNA-1 protein AED:1.00 eAED:1.00 QI:0/-1/0/0/-1/1/1/0/325
MEVKYNYLCGIVGGLGPKASAVFYDKNLVEARIKLHKVLVENQHNSDQELLDKVHKISTATWKIEALKKLLNENNSLHLQDQDHVPVLLYSNTQIAARPEYILTKKGVNPGPEIARTCEMLLKGGAQSLSIVCNTAHYFWPDAQRILEAKGYKNFEFIDMLKLSFEFIMKKEMKKSAAKKLKIGLLATDGSIKAQIFPTKAREVSEDLEVVTTESFENFNEAVHGKKGVKSGFATARNLLLVLKDMKYLYEQGIEYVLLGCTELPLLFTEDNIEEVKKTRKKTEWEVLDYLTLVDPCKILGDEILHRSLLSRENIPIDTEKNGFH